MKDTDIVIYERDSKDIIFTLSPENEGITEFLPTDKIIWVLRYGNDGRAIMIKELTDITGTTVTFSLTRQDTHHLYPQTYVYDIAVLKGDTQRTTILKSGKFVVSNKEIKTKDNAEISVDALQQYNLLLAQAETYAEQAKENSEKVNVFTPSVDDEGTLSWTNKAGLDNPAPVNIKGQKGDKGDPGSITPEFQELADMVRANSAEVQDRATESYNNSVAANNYALKAYEYMMDAKQQASGFVKSVNSKEPDEDGNIQIEIPDISGKLDSSHVTDTALNVPPNSQLAHTTVPNAYAVLTTLNSYVPITRTVNNKVLSRNITLSASDVGASPSDHTHSQYLTSHQDISGKQDKLIAGENINIDNNVISATGDVTKVYVDTKFSQQDTSIASVNSKANNNSTQIADLDRRLIAAQNMINDIYYWYETDSTEAYTKQILSGAKAFDLKKLGGKSVVMSQVAKPFSIANGYSGDVSRLTFNADGSMTVTGNANANAFGFSYNLPVATTDHIYLVVATISDVTYSDNAPKQIKNELNRSKYVPFTNNYMELVNVSSGASQRTLWLNVVFNGANASSSFKIKNFMIFDLTKTYGSEASNVTPTVFKSIIPNDYYPYNEGTLLSVPVEQVVVRGKNLIPFPYNDTSKTINGVTFTVENDGAIRVSGVASADTVFSVSTGEIMQIKPNTTYTLSGIHSIGSISGRIDLQVTDAKTTAYSITTVGGRLPFAYADVSKFRVNIEAKSGAVINNVVFKPQVELGESATSYSKYTSPNIIPLPASAKTDGWSAGTVANYVDFARKKKVQIIDKILLTDCNLQANGGDVFSGKVPNLKGETGQGLCTEYDVISYTTSAYDKVIKVGLYYADSGTTIFIKDARFNGKTKAEVDNLLQGVYLYYELATSIETDIEIDSRFEAILCEGNGSITFENGTDYNLPVMNEEEFLIKLSEV